MGKQLCGSGKASKHQYKNQLCIDAMDNDDQQVVLHPAFRKQEVPHTASIKYTSMFLEIRFQWKQLCMETAVAMEIFQRTLKLKSSIT